MILQWDFFRLNQVRACMMFFNWFILSISQKTFFNIAYTIFMLKILFSNIARSIERGASVRTKPLCPDIQTLAEPLKIYNILPFMTHYFKMRKKFVKWLRRLKLINFFLQLGVVKHIKHMNCKITNDLDHYNLFG